MKRGRVAKIVTCLCTALVLALLGWYIANHLEDFSALVRVPVGTVCLSVLLSAASIVVDTYYIKVTMEALGAKVDIVDWLGIPTCSGLIGNFVPLRADLLIKGAYYKKKCGFSYGKFISMTAGGTVIQASVIAVELAICLCMWGVGHEMAWLPLICALALLLLIGVMLYLIQFQSEFLLRHVPLKSYTHPVINGFREIIRNRRVMMLCVLSVIAAALINAFRLYVLARGIDIHCNLFQALLYGAVYQFCGLLPLLPGNIGITESLLGVVGLAAGNLFDNGVMISLLARVSGLLGYAILALVFIIPVVRRVWQSDCTVEKKNRDGKPNQEL